MKKLLAFLFSISCFVGANAQRVEIDGIMYELRQEERYDEAIGEYVNANFARVTYMDDANDFVVNIAKYKGEINIPESIEYDGTIWEVDEIGGRAFKKCKGLTNIILPNSIKRIEYEAFSESGIQKIEIPSSVNYFSSSIFSHCIFLSSVVLPEGLKEISSGMFYNCTLLQSINIPSTIELIRGSAFENCRALKEIELPEGLTEIHGYAFNNCTSLSDINLPSTLIELGEHSLDRCAFKSIKVPDGITTVKSYVFSSCRQLESVELPASVVVIEGRAFNDCSALKSIDFPSQLLSIGDNAFRDCRSLTEVTIPESVVVIGNEAFDGCTDLVVYNNSGLDFVCNDGSVHVFTDYLIDGDFIFNHVSTEPVLAQYNGSAKELILPDSYNGKAYSIGNGAFFKNDVLTSVVLPEECLTIGNNAFEQCRNLLSISLPSNLNSIGARAFQYCNSIREISLPRMLAEIGEYAFYDCGNLKTIYNYSSLDISNNRGWGEYGFVGYYAENIYNDVYVDNSSLKN